MKWSCNLLLSQLCGVTSHGDLKIWDLCNVLTLNKNDNDKSLLCDSFPSSGLVPNFVTMLERYDK